MDALILVTLPPSGGGCSEGCADYLNEPCLLSERQAHALRARLRRRRGITCDFSSGGHGCVLELDTCELADGLHLQEVTPDEAATLVRLSLAAWPGDCVWFTEFMEAGDEDEEAGETEGGEEKEEKDGDAKVEGEV